MNESDSWGFHGGCPVRLCEEDGEKSVVKEGMGLKRLFYPQGE